MSLINFYSKLPKKYLNNKINNPHYNIHGISLPAFICVSGRTGSGKTNAIINFLSKSSGTFDEVIICCKNFNSDPLYRFIQDKNRDSVSVYEDIIPNLDEFDSSKQYFVIIDDMVGDKIHTKSIQEFFKRGRKLGISCAFLTQDYFATDSFLRKNMNYLWLFPSNTKLEMNNICRSFNFIKDQDNMNIVEQATDSKKNSDGSKPLDFINIDCIRCKVKLNF
jgi:hypothetical protein